MFLDLVGYRLLGGLDLSNPDTLELPDALLRVEKLSAERAEQPCLDADRLAELNGLAVRCEAVYGPARDLEWAFAGGELYLCSAGP